VKHSLLDKLSRIPIAVIDTETTGVSPRLGHRVIEVGIVRLEGGREVAHYQQLVDPSRWIPHEVTAMTGITQEMVTGQPSFDSQLPRVLEMLSGAAVLGHNIRFDLSFLEAEFRLAGRNIAVELAGTMVLDTLRLARRRLGRRGNTLTLLSRRLGVEPAQSHRALADAQTTAAIYQRLLEPLGCWECCLCDALAAQGGPVSILPKSRTRRIEVTPWDG